MRRTDVSVVAAGRNAVLLDGGLSGGDARALHVREAEVVVGAEVEATKSLASRPISNKKFIIEKRRASCRVKCGGAGRKGSAGMRKANCAPPHPRMN